jgi:O-antigen ligase
MLRTKVVRYAAAFWGLTVFMPVGVTWASAFLLLGALLLAPDRRERAARLRASPLWWPLVIYVAWTLLVLALRPHYPETPSNLVHGLRIALTIAMALALTHEEALAGLRGFVAIALANIVYIGLFYLFLMRWGIWLPMPGPLRGVIMLIGNKSISNALLFTMLGAAGAAIGLAQLAARRPGRALAAFGVTLAAVAIITTNLPSRTSLLALLIVLPAICLHQWRRQWRALALSLALGAGVLAVAAWQAPWVEQKIAVGVAEIEAANNGTVSEGSWVVRYYMYTETARMIAERPLAGWGIGAWNSEWRRRGPPLLADYNMPHNDYLWMGSQAGLPGMLALLAIIVVGVWQAWQRPDLTGRIAFSSMLILLMATGVNSALRDAQIGLAILWIAMLTLRLAAEAGGDTWNVPWRRNIGRR